MATETRARRTAIATMTAAEVAELRWRLADAAFRRGDLVEAREHALAATAAPRRRPRRAERAPEPYTDALDARRDREIADRVEHWRALLARNRRVAERAVREIAERMEHRRALLAGEPSAEARAVRELAAARRNGQTRYRLPNGSKQLPRGVIGAAGTPAEIAARIVSWEMTHPQDPLTPASVRRRSTRARKSST